MVWYGGQGEKKGGEWGEREIRVLEKCQGKQTGGKSSAAKVEK